MTLKAYPDQQSTANFYPRRRPGSSLKSVATPALRRALHPATNVSAKLTFSETSSLDLPFDVAAASTVSSGTTLSDTAPTRDFADAILGFAAAVADEEDEDEEDEDDDLDEEDEDDEDEEPADEDLEDEDEDELEYDEDDEE